MTENDPDLLGDLIEAGLPQHLLARVVAALRQNASAAQSGFDIAARLDDLRAEIEEAKRGILDDGEQGDIFAPTLVKSAKSRRGKGGRPAIADWDNDVRREVFRVMDERGEFSPAKPEWNAQARLEEHLEAFCQDELHISAEIPTIRRQARPMLQDWRNKGGSKH